MKPENDDISKIIYKEKGSLLMSIYVIVGFLMVQQVKNPPGM